MQTVPFMTLEETLPHLQYRHLFAASKYECVMFLFVFLYKIVYKYLL